MSDYTHEVAAGMEWLDEKIPDWVDLIDTSTLELDNTCDCILGQTIRGLAVRAFGDKINITTRGEIGFIGSTSWRGTIPGYTMAVIGQGAPEIVSMLRVLGIEPIGTGVAISYGFCIASGLPQAKQEWAKLESTWKDQIRNRKGMPT